MILTRLPISDSNQPLDFVPNYLLIYSKSTTPSVIKMKMKIVALFLCLSQLVASEDVAATKDLNARNEVTSKSIFSKIHIL